LALNIGNWKEGSEMIENKIWILVYKVKLTHSKKWITHTQMFKTTDLMLARHDQLSRVFKKDYKLIIYSCGSLEG
jgi:hypothetical protein